jgi:hypothetical protein
MAEDIPESTKRHLDNASRRISITLDRMEIRRAMLDAEEKRIGEKYQVAKKE